MPHNKALGSKICDDLQYAWLISSPYVHQTQAKTENRRIQNGLRIRKRKLVDIGEISDEEE